MESLPELERVMLIIQTNFGIVPETHALTLSPEIARLITRRIISGYLERVTQQTERMQYYLEVLDSAERDVYILGMWSTDDLFIVLTERHGYYCFPI